LVEVEELQPLLYPAYERLYGRVVAKARERLSFEVADDLIAKDLQTDAGESVVRIERLALDHAGQPLEWRVSHGPAGRFVYEAEIT
jgi:GntR family transcriptional regulator